MTSTPEERAALAAVCAVLVKRALSIGARVGGWRAGLGLSWHDGSCRFALSWPCPEAHDERNHQATHENKRRADVKQQQEKIKLGKIAGVAHGALSLLMFIASDIYRF